MYIKKDNSEEVKPPTHAISFDPGSRNLGVSFIIYIGKFTEKDIVNDENYVVVDGEGIDLKMTPSGSEGDNTLVHLSEMVQYHFGNTEVKTFFLLNIKKWLDEELSAEDIVVFIENQQGIGPQDRMINPYLADELMPLCFIAGAIDTTMRVRYSIENIRHPAKTSKWGGSSCPKKDPPKGVSKTALAKHKREQRSIRKIFFYEYILDLLVRQRNEKLYTKLKGYGSEDGEHITDSICQGMRGLMICLVEWLNNKNLQSGGKAIDIPRNSLPDPVFNRIKSALFNSAYKFNDSDYSTFVPKVKKEKGKKKIKNQKTIVTTGSIIKMKSF
jgi:hypothetical protein